MHCRDHAVQLHRAREEFEAAGVGLHFIGQASPRQAQHFRRKLGLEPLTVLADHDRTTYAAAGLKRGNVTQLLGPRSVLAGAKHAARSGVVQGKPIGDVAQLGGAAIVVPGGEVVYEQVQRNAGDTVEPAALLHAAKEAT